MKIGIELKLGIFILAIFGLLIAGFSFWKPICVTYYKYQIGSANKETHEAAVKYLLDADAVEPVKYYYENRYASKDVSVRLAVVDELCGFGGKGKELMYEIFRARCKSEMVLIPAGSFMMGSENGNPDERPVHKVMLDAFWMDKYEVTNEKYYTFEKCSNHGQTNHWQSKGIPAWTELHPVGWILWVDAVNYAQWLKMRLPTEAEWEYACRAGSTTEYYFGDNANELSKYAWFYKNSANYPNPVGIMQPNKWWLFDMHGNVWEWCSDGYDDNYYTYSPLNNPQGPDSGVGRVLRGGSWYNEARHCRTAYRGGRSDSVKRDSGFGFRLVYSSSVP
jgi:formylglycine-generating enzyme required for sulfatase activity